MAIDLQLAGKTAIVTGGSAGIGLATAKALYSEGVSVAIAARNPERVVNSIENCCKVQFYRFSTVNPNERSHRLVCNT